MERYIKENLFSVTEKTFDELALEVFRFQAEEVQIYKEYLHALNVSAENVGKISEIPFLPIELFKKHAVLRTGAEPKIIFESSGTTGSISSKHFVADPAFYLKTAQHTFEEKYGNLSQYTLLALLPSYLEKGGSSLVYMVNHFIQLADERSGFFLHETEALRQALTSAKADGKKILLWGVTYALLDFAEKLPIDLSDCIVMDTGGMKGRKKEVTRAEIQVELQRNLNIDSLHSEYGMTELLSQCYASSGGNYTSPSWLKVLSRDMNDPFSSATRNYGGLNIIDLANIDSCCFIETKDIVRTAPDDTFEILGRFDNSDIRGCSQLAL